MNLATISCVYIGYDQTKHRTVHLYVKMTPAPMTRSDQGFVITYKTTIKRLSTIVYWFMVKILRYRVIGAK